MERIGWRAFVVAALVGVAAAGVMIACEKFAELPRTYNGVQLYVAPPARIVSPVRGFVPAKTVLYIRLSDQYVARALCIDFGLDAKQQEKLYQQQHGTEGRTQGCFVDPVALIVCAGGDDACVKHEERHWREGNFHPHGQ